MAIAGRVAMIPKGDYDATVTYQILDIVRYNDASYVAKKSSTGMLPTDTEYWMLMTQDGLLVDDALSETSERPAQNKVVNEAIQNIINGTTPAGDSNKLGGKGASEYALIKCELVNTSILEKALTLESGVYNFELGRGNYTGEDLPSKQYAYGMAGVYKPAGGGAVVVLWNQRYGLPLAINQHNGTSWLGWDTNATTADLANYLPLNCSKSLTGEMKFENAGGLGILGSGNDLIRLMTAYSSADTTNRREIILYNASQRATTDRTLQLLDVVNGKTTWLDILHSGNVGSYALPIGGGTVGSGFGNIPVTIKGKAASLLSYVIADGTLFGTLGFSAVGKLNMSDGSNTYGVHHDGNSAKVVQATSAPSDTTAVWVDTANKKVKAYIDGAWTALA